jgi:hypothetical protein
MPVAMRSIKHIMNISQIIIHQINILDRWALLAYGSKDFSFIEESSEFQGGLTFRVNGLHHKGQVSILLKWSDVYVVRFSKNGIVLKENDEVYCDMLIEVLDYIEFGEK